MAKDKKADQKKKKPKPGEKQDFTANLFTADQQAAKVMMMLKNVSLTYTETNGTTLPGYVNTTKGIGVTGSKPTLGFVFGSQKDICAQIGQRGAMTKAAEFNNAYTQTLTVTWNATIEPVTGFRITVKPNQPELCRKFQHHLQVQ